MTGDSSSSDHLKVAATGTCSHRPYWWLTTTTANREGPSGVAFSTLALTVHTAADGYDALEQIGHTDGSTWCSSTS